MKKIAKISDGILRIFAIVLLLSVYFIEPISVNAKEASTLRELRAELTALQNKKSSNESKKKLTQSEIQEKNKAIANALSEITASEEKIEEAKALIEETDTKIAELKKQTEELMAYFQIMQGENVYMEFVTDSSSMTELIMRQDAVNQLAKYNQEKLVELDDLINESEQLQVDLIKYEEELQSNITKYESSITDLEYDLSSLDEIGMDIDDEIRSKKELIKTYEDMGCKEDQDLEECASISGNAIWYKPLTKGRVNSIFGARIDPFTGKTKVHKAVDLGGNSEGTNVYAVGNGIVVATTDAKAKKASKGTKTCGGNQVYLQVKIAGKYYTVQYAHLLTINVSVGDVVNVNTVIGTQGGGSKTSSWESCSTGTHLHFGVVEGTVSSNSSFASVFSSKAVKPPGFPNKGGWFYSRTQWFG